MGCFKELLSFHIIQRENNSNLFVWSYPGISDPDKKYILRKTFLSESNLFIYLRKNAWIYIQQFYGATNSLPNISGFAVVLISKELNPKKYETICDILCKLYFKSNNPVELVKLYLDTCISGCCKCQENGTAMTKNIKGIKSSTGIKDFIRKFGLEVILIYTALLLKRRVIVYHHDISKLQKNILSITSLVQRRNPDTYLFPFVENISEELKGVSFFVAGITDDSVQAKTASYDIFVNLLAQEISISPQSKVYFTMTKIHKDIAVFLVNLSEKDLSEDDIVSEISSKTDELFKQLHTLASVNVMDKKMITIEDLKNKQYSPAVENFLFNFAEAENMMML